jgi:dienelactone hydrolase
MRPLPLLLALVVSAPSVFAQVVRRAGPEEVSPLPAAAGADIARQVAAELKAGDFAALESRFDERLTAAMPDAALRVFWAQTLQQAGALRGCAEPEMSVGGEYTLAFAACTFEKQKAELRLTLRPDGRLAGLFLAPESAVRPEWSAPDYVTPSAFTERETSVATGLVTLPATLSIPKGDGPFPGVVLVHGSGPHDRDETIGGTRVFQDLAQGLASRGIVVLRYEKRTKAYPRELAGRPEMTLKDEVVDDAVAALVVLRAAPGVDQARVFVLGHSLGGLLAPRIAARDRGSAGVILLAAPSRPMSEVVRDQVEALGGPWASDVEKATVPALRREAAALGNLYAGKRPASPSATIFGAPPAYWLELKAQTPALSLRALGVPVLVLQGGRDTQVSMKDFALWQRSLKGMKRTTLKSYPKLNHLFVAGEGPGTPAEYEKVGHVARDVVEDVAAFVLRGALRPVRGAGATKAAPKKK